MSRPFGVHLIGDIYTPNAQSSVDGRNWFRAVCQPYTGNRIRAAWWVLTGRAYAVVWPRTGELEAALGPVPTPVSDLLESGR